MFFMNGQPKQKIYLRRSGDRIHDQRSFYAVQVSVAFFIEMLGAQRPRGAGIDR